jgi:RNA-directed DNA polymerase
MDLFEQIADFENLHAAYRAARVCKRYRTSILKFGFHVEENLITLQREFSLKTYRHGGYREFIVTESKKRLIKAAPFRDRVVHHALCNIIEPIFERSFIYDSYACRIGKGTHRAVRRLENFIQSIGSVSRERERERE